MDFIYHSNQIAYFDAEGKLLAEVTFPEIEPDVVDINHTFVDQSLRGQGIAGRLIEAAAKEIRSRNKKAVLSCPYAQNWLEKHPEYSDIIK